MNVKTLIDYVSIVELNIEQTNERPLKLKTSIIKVINKNTFTIESPTYKRTPYIIKIGTILPVYCVYGNISNGDLYYFDCKITSKGNSLKGPFYELQAVGTPKKAQRRDAYRAKVSIDCEVLFNENKHTLTTTDLSCTGVKCTSTYKFDNNSEIIIYLPINNNIMTVKGLVVDSVQSDESNIYIVRIMFLNIPLKDERKISTYLFKLQSKDLKVKLIAEKWFDSADKEGYTKSDSKEITRIRILGLSTAFLCFIIFSLYLYSAPDDVYLLDLHFGNYKPQYWSFPNLSMTMSLAFINILIGLYGLYLNIEFRSRNHYPIEKSLIFSIVTSFIFIFLSLYRMFELIAF